MFSNLFRADIFINYLKSKLSTLVLFLYFFLTCGSGVSDRVQTETSLTLNSSLIFDVFYSSKGKVCIYKGFASFGEQSRNANWSTFL